MGNSLPLAVRAPFITLLLFLLFSTSAQAFDISIQISPNVLNLGSKGEVVTVHTTIDYWLVDVYSVHLNGVEIQSWKADDRGDFVAKFDLDAIKSLDGLRIDGYNEFILVGATIDEEAFIGTAEIFVKSALPKSKALK
ncbi:MAG: hypothetical protein V2I79_07805 [Xanthomonadales bacterium]|jgi:hypothetical protein|nr:hypothetical protein [Xanthomonadales bacterium]